MSPARPRVLVADDHAEVAKAVCGLLAPDCEIVGTVADGSALVEAVQRLKPDVVVLDVNLPNVHGVEACRQLTQLNPAPKVVGFSAMSEPQVSEAFLAAGASAFVSKLASADLLPTIPRVCAPPRVDRLPGMDLRKVVGAARFELTTLCSQSRCASQAALRPDIGDRLMKLQIVYCRLMSSNCRPREINLQSAI